MENVESLLREREKDF